MLQYPNLPLVEERFKNILKAENLITKGFNCSVIVFPQMWGSTSLGFEGLGGCAMTEAYTTVIIERNSGIYGVFFDESFAYMTDQVTPEFLEDLQKRNMKSVSEAKKYY